MKGIRFYEEFKNKRKPETSKGNVIALLTDTRRIESHWKVQLIWDSVSAVFFRPNSSVCYSSVCQEYLQEKCKRVSEERARQVHPKLFEYLEA